MERACAYCEASPLEWVAEEGLLHCVACGRSSLASGEPVDDAPAAQVRLTAPNGVRRLESRVRARGAPGESSPLPAAALGISFTVLFYLVLQAFPESMLFELFARRGWVPYGITAISS